VINALSVDVEESFHATEVRRGTRLDGVYNSRVEAQTDVVLELLQNYGGKATFFVLGCVAAQHPTLVRKIVDAGHEIGCHSHDHHLVYDLTPDQFRTDTLRAVRAIEDACGKQPLVYRAPSYSITDRSLWALEILVECGFTHDSSIYPIQHDRYGIPGFRRHAHIVQTPVGPIHEVPIATVHLSRTNVAPVGGGGYLRLLPYRYTAAGIRRVNRDEQEPVCIYFHPWELDPAQPRTAKGVIARLRTYGGLNGMRGKIVRLLTEFQFDTMQSVFPAWSEVSPIARAAKVCAGD
jgi:polysaccharide deacetylase family protein (PEP-CTERM system associated)